MAVRPTPSHASNAWRRPVNALISVTAVPATASPVPDRHAVSVAVTTYGAIGIKVWIYKGAYGEQAAVPGEARLRRRARR